MKKCIFLVLFLFLSVGCSVQTTKEDNDVSKIQNGDITSYEDVFTAEDFEEDIDGDGQKERIILNISPAPQPHPDNEGQYLWDSSHVWQLIVEDKGDYFILFDDHVQGLAEMYVVSEEENQFSIVFLQKGTSLTLTEFRYKGDYFEKEVRYNSLMRHRSLVR